MQRKATKTTRGPDAQEKRFQGYIKSEPCCWCGNESGSIVDHIKGATFKHNKTLIGHWFVLPNCQECDQKKTVGGERLGDYAQTWLDMVTDYECKYQECPSSEVIEAVKDWGGSWQNG